METLDEYHAGVEYLRELVDLSGAEAKVLISMRLHSTNAQNGLRSHYIKNDTVE